MPRARGVEIVSRHKVAAASAAASARALGTWTYMGSAAAAAAGTSATGSISPAANGMLLAIVAANSASALTSVTGLSGTWTVAATPGQLAAGSDGLYFHVYACKDYSGSGAVTSTLAAVTQRIHVIHLSVKPTGTFAQVKNRTGPGFSTTGDTVTLDTTATRETFAGFYSGGDASSSQGGMTTLQNVNTGSFPLAIGASASGARSSFSSNWAGNQFCHGWIIEVAE